MTTFKKLIWGATASAALSTGAFAQAARPPAERSLSFENVHTGESLSITYWRGGQYDSEALKAVSRLLRDRTNGQVQDINPELLDALHDIKVEVVRQKPGLNPAFQVISGFRSVVFNQALRDKGAAVAQKSQHTQGNAMDIRIPGVPLSMLVEAACNLKKGGVGYYPEVHNNFVHVDVARVRYWPAAIGKFKSCRRD